MFLSSYRNTSGSLGEGEMLREHEPQMSVSTCIGLMQVMLTFWLAYI